MPSPLQAVARLLIVYGAVAVLLGVVLLAVDRVPYLGRLPGDIAVQRKGFSFYFPVTTSLVVSLVLSLVFSWLGKK
jgi:hypothetical protein